nr:MAG TPA: hypothetical protein [Caudoviricetes sp.]
MLKRELEILLEIQLEIPFLFEFLKCLRVGDTFLTFREVRFLCDVSFQVEFLGV